MGEKRYLKEAPKWYENSRLCKYCFWWSQIFAFSMEYAEKQ